MSGTLDTRLDVAFPHSAISPTLEGDVLIALAGTTRPLTGREVARLARRGAPAAVSVALNRLVEQGLVLREEAGRAFLHRLNRDHLAAPAVLVLAGLRTALLERLRAEIGGWELQPVSAAMFGSAARGDGDTASDIDLLLVRPSQVDEADELWRTQLSQLADHVHAWTGNHASLVELTEADLPGQIATGPPALEEIQAQAIALAGIPPALLLPALERA
jgi:predicted nucleotidyltransferase